MKTMLKAFGIIAVAAVIVFTLSCGGGGGGNGGGPTSPGGGPVAGGPTPPGGGPAAGGPESPGSEPESMIEMVPVPAGSFYMGSPVSEFNRMSSSETQHLVTLTEGFNMGRYPVTQEQYEKVMGAAVGEQAALVIAGFPMGVGKDYPMYYVNWYEAVVFCNKLSVMEGLTPAYSINGGTDPSTWGPVPTSYGNDWDDAIIIAGSTGYRLPTEAQWEYACRGDYPNKDTEQNTKPFGIGDGTKITGDMANFNGTKPYDLFGGGEYSYGLGNYIGETTPVGYYSSANANSYGLYDMHGNVFEWCWDWYDDYLGITETDPEGAAASGGRVLRGGCWNMNGQYLRSAFRNYNDPGNRHNVFGFRLVRP